ncbi:uncharacterized protein BDV17DRAFT_294141 [Aspergillus undulatus]|uniref:uncharacterized protein n=1 Tax=Aspergillus undulatus TaxID=1810928 RepID=UPI003CCCDC91
MPHPVMRTMSKPKTKTMAKSKSKDDKLAVTTIPRCLGQRAPLRSLTNSPIPTPPVQQLKKHTMKSEDQKSCSKIERCIHDLIEDQALARPEQEAICAHDGCLSYAELENLSSGLANELICLEASAEQRVAIMMSKSVWYPVAVLAVLKSGAAFVPLDPSHPEARLKQLAAETEPCAVITTTPLLMQAQILGCSRLLTIDKFDSTSTYAAPAPVAAASPDNAAYIIFTSGSTGKPKGVVVEHAALATSAVKRGVVLGLRPESRVLQYAPHTFDVSVDEILTTWIHGGCVCVPSENDRFAIEGFMEAAKVTAALLTPTSARTLNPDDVPSLRTLQTGGEVLTEDVNDKWSGRVILFNVYGPTEASVACVIGNRTGLLGTGNVLGQPVGGKLWVVDPDDVSRRLSPNEIGELVISGPILARGYYRDSVRTEASFVRLPKTGERVYRTGDLASMDADGTISYHGRKDLEIKIRGQRINIAEVENAILQCDVAHSAVVEYPRSGPCIRKLTAIIRIKNPGHESGKTAKDPFASASQLSQDMQTLLHSHVSGILPSAMVPSKWLVLPTLPQMSSGKADRKQVRAWLEGMDEKTHSRLFHGPRTDSTPSNDACLAMWSEVLKLEPQNIHMDQSFIRNGGDSITAMEARRLSLKGGLVINIPDLLGGLSLNEICQKAASTALPTSSLTLEKDTNEPFPLSPVQRMYFDKMGDVALNMQQRVHVDMAQPVHPDIMRTALNYVIKKHDMLATRFLLHEGTWVQRQPLKEDIEPESQYHFFTDAPASLSDFCTEAMDIVNGPLLHAHLVTSGSSRQALALCVHHLVVDFVSWRVILHDLHEGLVAAQSATVPQQLSSSTLTFQQWSREEIKYASSLEPATVLPFGIGPLDLSFWQPAGAPALSNTFSDETRYNFRLSARQTAQLLDRFTIPSSVHPTDVMISTFAMAFRRIFPERDTPNIFIESHGREPWHPSLDVSQTVGWFTAAYPMHLPKDTLSQLTNAIRAASERRQAIPNNGHSYWACRYLSDEGRRTFGQDVRHREMEVVFNYAGTVIQRAADQKLLGESVRITEVGHPECSRFSLFDIAAAIEQPEHRLVITYSFPKSIAHQERIQELIQTHREMLIFAVEEKMEKMSINELLSPQLSIPKDVAHQLEARGIDADRDVENVYAASAIQQNMLRRQRLEPWCYLVRGTWTVDKSTEGSPSVDMHRLAKAWSEVVRRHSTLRTVFLYSQEQQQFSSVALHDVQSSIIVRQSSGTDCSSLCREPETLGPPHRMVLQELGDGRVECQLEFSHAIIDAASRSTIIQDLADAYEGKLEHRTLDSPPFWTYASRTQTAGNHSDSSTALQKDRPFVGRVVSLAVDLACSGTSIFDACKTNGITMSSFFMAAWSGVLSQNLNNHAVSFDYVQSDRSVDIPGIEQAVGPYLRLPACEVVVEPGPVVRINPFELHVQDPDFYPVLYTGPTHRRHKWPWAARMFGNNTSAFSTVAHDHHRLRRSALNPLFSRTAIQRMTPRIQNRLRQLCHRLDGISASWGVVDLGLAFTVFAADVITEYCFGRSLDLVHSPNFAADWVEMVAAPSELGHLVKQCPWILPLLWWFPRWAVRAIVPGVALLYQIQERMSRQIQPLAERKPKNKNSRPTTVFDILLAGDLPPAEKTVQRLKGEGQTIIGAGTLTTGNALKTMVFHIQANPHILQSLRTELDTALSDVDPLNMPDSTHLERLPYLTSCIWEGLRLAYGVTHRLQLIAEEPLNCAGKEIPAGTPVGMTSIFMHDNPVVFPDPRTFRPERWLGMDPETRGKIMGRHFVPFSKGSRMCLGMHLAYAELYLVLATVFRRYEVQLMGVTRDDIDMAHDFFDPAPKQDSKGLIVRLGRRAQFQEHTQLSGQSC